jgi:hypothetical protein
MFISKLLPLEINFANLLRCEMISSPEERNKNVYRGFGRGETLRDSRDKTKKQKARMKWRVRKKDFCTQIARDQARAGGGKHAGLIDVIRRERDSACQLVETCHAR